MQALDKQYSRTLLVLPSVVICDAFLLFFSCYQTGKSRWMRSHDSNGCCPRVSDCPGLPPGSPRMSGGLARLFGAVRLLSARKHAAFKKGLGLGPQNCI